MPQHTSGSSGWVHQRGRIHFQIQQGGSFLFSAGLPVYFDGIINHTESSNAHYITIGQWVENCGQ